MGKYRLSKSADKEFEMIFDYGIDTFGQDQALTYQTKLKERFSLIAEQPYLYPAVEHIRAGYRRSVCGVHSIYYRIAEQGVVIMHILGRQNPKKQEWEQ
ncbi:MAG: type II toxin-antitoxin system RelE/ParE family toxin [Nitrospirales bacterium]|nr:type II toxin-antitoxin system RelE/ParE family toxin [Nitrospira sp.]MDR4500765.1 type II toxin-antitoxin system RelE/ParE family toxin [Nitrospirales bacterium]